MMMNSLKVTIWKYLILFSVLILAFLWTFQVLFLNQYYKWEKRKDIKEVANQISRAKTIDSLKKIINSAAYYKNICVELTNHEKSLYSSKYLSRGCFSGKEENIHYKSDFIMSNRSSTTYQIVHPDFQNQTLIYALKVNSDLYAFVNTSLDPIDSTIMILKNQFIYVTFLVLILSFVIAYFISRYISKPIIQINDTAKKLSKNDFDISFCPSKISEINELSSTLNHTRNELYKTEELRRDLMANVSHDLKTPLTMIRAYAEMSRDLNGYIEEKRRKNMNVIIEEVDRLTLLVNDILTLSSIQSELSKLDLSTFDLVALIHTILKRYSIFIEKENYQFIFKNKRKIMITADQRKIEQVIYNLMNNAINYTKENKKVTIQIIQKKDSIRVEIRNTGEEIPKEELPYIWDKYYRVKKNHKREVVGTGLGLSIVKSILEKHHYSYGVCSKRNHETTFYFEIKKENKS